MPAGQGGYLSNVDQTPVPQGKLQEPFALLSDESNVLIERCRPSIYGFPLFDISGSALRDSTTWTFYNSATVKPNLTRLDLSRNLVVLDFQSLSPSRTNLKYIVIQLHTSEEILLQSGSDYRWYKYIFTGNLINPYDKVDFTPQFAIDSGDSSLAAWFNIFHYLYII